MILRVICTGGTGLIPAIAQWLQQKFPNADIIQDTPPDTNLAGSNRIASGLALLPYFPTILDTTRHQYSDYFLLRELLNRLPSQPNRALSIAHVLHILENQGINTNACQTSIRNLLDGQLPTGLVPTKASAVVLTPTARQNPDYRALLATPLFARQDNQTYQVNAQQRDRFWNYLQAILANTHQTLNEPLTVSLVTPTVV
ncbi:MAG: hypothetical protein HC866_20000 [Leptolyngbyaceae cyanobacterium RU_5_1]|nr:hypothetical protein [Leptolyngbyaceae cyanobacterium RU_5_1]